MSTRKPRHFTRVEEKLELSGGLTKLCFGIRNKYYQEYRAFVFAHQGVDPVNAGKNYNEKWDGGVCLKSGRKRQNAWLKILQYAFNNGIDPHCLISGAFHYWPNFSQPPFPNQLYSETALKYGIAFKKNYFKEKLAYFKSSVASLCRHIKLEHSMREGTNLANTAEAIVPYILLSKESDPLACVVVALRYGQKDLIKKFIEPAALTYLIDTDRWKRSLGDALPVEVVEYAESVLLPCLKVVNESASSAVSKTFSNIFGVSSGYNLDELN